MSNFIKLLRNSSIYATRDAATSALQTQLPKLTDGEICVASYGDSWGKAKSIFGITRDQGGVKSYTIFDIDQQSSDVDKAIAALNADITGTSQDGTVEVQIIEANGKITTVNVTTDLDADKIKYTDDMTVSATLKKLMDKNFPLSVSCSITPSGLQELGTTASVVIISNFSASVDGKPVTVTSKTVNGEIITGESWTTSDVKATTTYAVNITAEGTTKPANQTITFVGPIYVGYNTSTVTPTEVDTTLTKQSLRTSVGNISYVGSTSVEGGAYITIYSPYKVSHVYSAGFDIFSEFTDTTFDSAKYGITYHRYQHNGKTASADITIS